MERFELLSFANADELACAAAGAWLQEIEAANGRGLNFCVALSGGRIASRFFSQTVEQARQQKVSFHGVHFFWADERCVPPTDPESNLKLANEFLLEPLKISRNHIHRIQGEKAAQAALKIAEEELRHFVSKSNQEGQPVLDLVFLGMGEDGHVASLFQNAMKTPGNDAKSNSSFLWVEDSPKPPPQRITLGYNAIAAAKSVWVLASGSGKEAALERSLKGETPLGRVIQSRKETKIFSDIRGGQE